VPPPVTKTVLPVICMAFLTFLAGCSLPLALGFESPRDGGYGFHGGAICYGQRRLAARRSATPRPL